MKKYKPEYLGKVIPDSPPKLKEFLMDTYEDFSTVYDACKDESDSISDVKNVTSETDTSSSLSVKVTTSTTSLDKLSKKIADSGDSDMELQGDVIIKKKKKKKKDKEEGD